MQRAARRSDRFSWDESRRRNYRRPEGGMFLLSGALPRTTHAEDLALCSRRTPQDVDFMVWSHLRLVFRVVQKYALRYSEILSDLYQEGFVGLLRAVEKFNPSLGFRFSTYADWWIRQAILGAIINTARVIRIPAHCHDKGKWRDLPPDAGHLDPSVLELRITDPGDTEERACRRIISQQVEAALGILMEREAMILRLRFGLGGAAPQTVRAVAVRIGVSPNRVHQLETRALGKLRANVRVVRVLAGLSE